MVGSIDRSHGPPDWAVVAVESHRKRIASLVKHDVSVKLSIGATIDWRATSDVLTTNPAIRLDWTLVELVLLAEYLQRGGVDGSDTVGVFDDRFGSAVFNEYSSAETVMVAEICRALCWSALRRDSIHAVRFHYERFMDYCARNQNIVDGYRQILRADSDSGRLVIAFLVGHEFAHFALRHPDRLSEQGLTIVGQDANKIGSFDDASIAEMSGGKIDPADFRRLITANPDGSLATELACDCIGVAYLIGIDQLDPKSVNYQDAYYYATTVHVVGWLTTLEKALFEDSGHTGIETFEEAVHLHGFRSYFLLNHLLRSFVFCTMLFVPERVTEIASAGKAANDFVYWLDRALSLFYEKTIFRRFDLKDLPPASFWLNDETEIVLDHLRRYPAFDEEDFAIARRISGRRPRGWTITEE